MAKFTNPPPISRVSSNEKLGSFCVDCGKKCRSNDLLMKHKASHIKIERFTDEYCFLCGVFCKDRRGIVRHVSQRHWKIFRKRHFQGVTFKVVVQKL